MQYEDKIKILEYMASGKTDKEMSEKLGCSRGTIRNRILELFGESGLRTRCELVTWGLQNGYIK